MDLCPEINSYVARVHGPACYLTSPWVSADSGDPQVFLKTGAAVSGGP